MPRRSDEESSVASKGDGGADDRHERKGRRHDRDGAASKSRSRSKKSDDDDRREDRARSDDGSEEGRSGRRRRDRSDSPPPSRDHKKSTKKSRERSRRDKRKKKKRRRRYRSSNSDDDDSSSTASSDDGSRGRKKGSSKGGGEVVMNERLLAKLQARGETLEERKERRNKRRAEHISAKFGYTNEDNPFNDSNLNETFVWTKKKQVEHFKGNRSKSRDGDNNDDDGGGGTHAKSSMNTLEEIEKVRRRRKERELQFEEMERIRAEESRMKELENYDDWARKEEEFHLQQQRQRSAIRLVEGREKPIDVLAKNVLLFGLSDEEKANRGGATVKYKERFNALEALENLDAELDEPQYMLKLLKLEELQELLVDIEAFRALEREACASFAAPARDNAPELNPVLRYWDALYVVAVDEIKFLQSGGANGAHAKVVSQVQSIFKDQSQQSLVEMQRDVRNRIRQYVAVGSNDGGAFDVSYWRSVDEQLTVFLAKMDLVEIYNQMLVRQLERLERRREELAKAPARGTGATSPLEQSGQQVALPSNVEPGFGDVEEDVGVAHEVDIQAMTKKYAWHDKYRPRKPRYFNRVKTGYDWNKYNQTHYDRDNPPPKVVQGYKFNIFYPDLIDPTKTPQFFLEPADSDEFCIIRFHAGPPYEDVAFKIINREWNKSRKQGYKCTFDRGVLSVYFNFTTHWYRR